MTSISFRGSPFKVCLRILCYKFMYLCSLQVTFHQYPLLNGPSSVESSERHWTINLRINTIWCVFMETGYSCHNNMLSKNDKGGLKLSKRDKGRLKAICCLEKRKGTNHCLAISKQKFMTERKKSNCAESPSVIRDHIG